jgi:hypothetical protein
MARPRLGASKKATRVSVFFTPAEYKDISGKAAANGMTPAEWLRRAGLKRNLARPVPEANLTLYRELARLAHDLRERQKPGWESGLGNDRDSLLREMQAGVAALRLSLVGGPDDNC